MQFNQLKRKTPHKKKLIVGRGGRRGKTSGRGTKGQKARSGHRIRPQTRDVMKRLPKQRGFKFPKIGKKFAIVSLGQIEKNFENDAIINPAILAEKKLIKKIGDKLPKVKILNNGEFSKKITVSSCATSASVKEKIEKAGGKVE